MAGDAGDEGGRRRGGDVQSGKWGELDDDKKYWLRGAGTGYADRYVAASARGSIPGEPDGSLGTQPFSVFNQLQSNSRDFRLRPGKARTPHGWDEIPWGYKSRIVPYVRYITSLPHGTPGPAPQNRTSFIFYDDSCAFSPPRSVSSTAFCTSPKYKSGRSSAKMGGKMATTVATIVMIFIVSL